MVATPVLIERPLVETDKGVRLCRPQEQINEII
jgi:arsenate reductase